MDGKEKKQLKKVDKDVNKLSRRLRKVRIKSRKKKRAVGNKAITRIIKNGNIMSGPGSNAIKFRKSGSSKEALRNVQLFRKFNRNQYLLGLIHPDEAVKKQIPIKLPSDLPLPTAAIGYHEQHQLTTSSVGTFLLSWRPNFFITQTRLNDLGVSNYSKITYNATTALSGQVSTGNNFFILGQYAPNIDIQRYRLVSACFKIQYNGSVLNQSGTFLSCITFDATSVAVSNTVTASSDTLIDRFGNFSIIANGLWNQSTDVTVNGHGLEAIFVPMDPLDVAFDRVGSYYGTTGTGVLVPGQDCAPQTYIFAGRNLPASANCLLIDIYYNFEVIADPSVAPILRATTYDIPTKREGRDAGDSLHGYYQEKGYINPISINNAESTWDRILGLGLKYIPMLLASL